MTQVAISGNMRDEWEKIVDGDGTDNYTNDGFKATLSASGTGRSYVFRRMPARAGSKITIRCLAKANSGSGQIIIDYTGDATLKPSVTIDSEDYQEYQISIVVPYTANVTTSFVQLNVGIFNPDTGSVDVINPTIETEFDNYGFARAWAMGLLRFERSGSDILTTVNDNFSRTGIVDIDYVSDEVQVTIQQYNTNVGDFARPIFSGQLTLDNLPDVTAKIGGYDATTGVVSIRFSDGAGFQPLNTLLADGEIAFMWFKAEGI